jgi:hypothetical protein
MARIGNDRAREIAELKDFLLDSNGYLGSDLWFRTIARQPGQYETRRRGHGCRS